MGLFSKLVIKWSQKADEQGNAAAQFNLDLIHHTGQGVQKDYDIARKWY